MATDITSILNEAPTQFELQHLLYDIRDKWYDIGLSLQIHHNILDDFKHSHKNDVVKLFAVIDYFLMTQPSPITWETVKTGIGSSIVNDKETADLICQYLRTDVNNILKEAPDDYDLHNLFSVINDKWYQIGLTLHVHCSVLDELKRSQKNDIDKLAEIIKIWKITHSSSVTWETMINALEDPKFKNKYIADKIRQHLKLKAIDRHFFQSHRKINTKISDSGDKKKLLDKAMEEGYVTTKWTKFSISGAPGTGKSSFLKLLFNEDPPDCHNSTPVILAKEARIIPASVGDNSMWRKIDHESLKTMIAKGVNDSIRPLKLEMTEKHQSSESKPINQPLDESFDQPTDQQDEISDSVDSDSSTTAGHDKAVDQSSLTITQEIIELIGHVGKSEELYQCHWIYGIDTGGQAAFIEIAPSLLRYNSVNILTHKLPERLCDKAKFFFNVQGKQIGEPKEKQITNLQLLEALFSSLSSIKRPQFQTIKPNFVEETAFVILGTFLDKMGFFGETLRNKNSVLASTLKEYSEFLITPKQTSDEVIFSVNTTARGSTEANLAKKIRNEICKYYIEAEIPIRWFLLQLELDNLNKSSKSKCIVSREKCFNIGKSLGMTKDMVEAALIYYHDLTVFLYFPKILPHVVFLHPQPLFNAMSHLISISFVDSVEELCLKGISLTPGAHVELKKNGTFKEDLLTSPNSHFLKEFQPEFTPQDFLKLLQRLDIIASLPNERKYFLPTVLPTTTDFTKYKSSPYRFKQCTDPLILSFKMKPLPRGVFPALVVNLLNRNNSPSFELVDPSKYAPRYRNAITLHTDYGDILLVDGIKWFSLYSIDHFKGCCALRKAIHAGILEVISKFHYKPDPKILDYFYCNICYYKRFEHFCLVNIEQTSVTCCKSRKTISLTESRQLYWFSKEGTPRCDSHSSSKGLKQVGRWWYLPLGCVAVVLLLLCCYILFILGNEGWWQLFAKLLILSGLIAFDCWIPTNDNSNLVKYLLKGASSIVLYDLLSSFGYNINLLKSTSPEQK